MTRNRLILLATLGSAALLLGAFAFQYVGGLAPCKLCIWQRWPHGAAILAGLLALGLSMRLFIALGALAAAATGLVGIYHTGVERGWWEGPTTCSAGSVQGLTPEELMAQILSTPLVRCDEVPWELLSLSMASWNAVMSFALVALWLAAWRRA